MAASWSAGLGGGLREGGRGNPDGGGRGGPPGCIMTAKTSAELASLGLLTLVQRGR
jgi:hypothetical protein